MRETGEGRLDDFGPDPSVPDHEGKEYDCGAVSSLARDPCERRWPARRLRLAVAFVFFVGFLFAAVFPTRTYLAQRGEITRAAQRLALLKKENGTLEATANRLQRDDEIERIARERLGLVKPGEEAYAVLPSPGRPGDPSGNLESRPGASPRKVQPPSAPAAPFGLALLVRDALARLF
jgi:cell division protein FtsB